jgi:hypothetical protein
MGVGVGAYPTRGFPNSSAGPVPDRTSTGGARLGSSAGRPLQIGAPSAARPGVASTSEMTSGTPLLHSLLGAWSRDPDLHLDRVLPPPPYPICTLASLKYTGTHASLVNLMQQLFPHQPVVTQVLLDADKLFLTHPSAGAPCRELRSSKFVTVKNLPNTQLLVLLRVVMVTAERMWSLRYVVVAQFDSAQVQERLLPRLRVMFNPVSSKPPEVTLDPAATQSEKQAAEEEYAPLLSAPAAEEDYAPLLSAVKLRKRNV